MSRRPGNTARRLSDGGGSFPFGGSTHKKSQTSPFLSVGLVILGAFLLIGYSYKGSGGFPIKKDVSLNDGGASCTLEVQRAIPVLKKAYGASMNKVLHVGPETCSVVSNMLKEDVSEVWGVEPYDLDDPDSECRSLVRKGFVRAADIKFPLPYQPKSFSLVIVSDALDYLSPKYVNKTLLELTRVSKDGLVVFTGFPGHQRMKVTKQSKFGRMAKLRSPSWWQKYFLQTNLEEDEAATKKFEQASSKNSYSPSCQIFHLST
ncbi:uncharacterized protein At3g49720-like [Asparagus officinalis]|uniref:uncharacterized protein At3g49720-like n=1 Tax=Asparagus officinalis TaxID=4686 RepID=UPI00098E6E78|nr:uncharacterized protein At3g49720-like [Asparagus officinalis]